MANFTPTQRRMLAVLADGLPHTRPELRSCLYDEQGETRNIRYHITMLRKLLVEDGQWIVCELYKGTIHYRHIRLYRTAPGVNAKV